VEEKQQKDGLDEKSDEDAEDEEPVLREEVMEKVSVLLSQPSSRFDVNVIDSLKELSKKEREELYKRYTSQTHLTKSSTKGKYTKCC
jgi:Mn-dependent DtxR family transcriptional regulator